MKRVFLIIFFVVSLLAGGFFILKAKNLKMLPSQAEIGNNVDSRAFNSFKGVIDLAFERPVIQTKDDDKPAQENQSEENEAPEEDKADFTFAILGDTQYFTSGNPQGNFQKAVASIKKMDPDLVISVGDLVRNCRGNNECRTDFADWKNTLGTLFSKTYAVQGNHDRVEDGPDCDKIWQETFNFPTNGPTGFSELAYSLDFGNSHFVFLDSNKPDGHQVNDDQRSWLEKNLAANSKANTFVIFHEPAYPTGYKMEESLDVQPSQRNALWEIMDRYNVTAVFNGHEHIVSRRKITSRVSSVAKNSIYQFVYGSTDSFDHTLPVAGVAEFANQGQGRFGFVKVKGKDITVETYDPNGKLLDTFTFSK